MDELSKNTFVIKKTELKPHTTNKANHASMTLNRGRRNDPDYYYSQYALQITGIMIFICVGQRNHPRCLSN